MHSYQQNIVLKPFVYYGTGGRCAELYAPSSVEELSAVLRDLSRKGTPYFFLGAGTNSLVADDNWPGAVVSFLNLNKLEISGSELCVGAGVENTALAQAALRAGLDGAAWMNRLPGQLGATVRMNARCYGGEISQIVTEITAVMPNGDIVIESAAGTFRGYKNTIFMQNGAAIAEVKITLQSNSDVADIERRMLSYERDREAKGQFIYPTCGCVFKNDYSVGVPSGMLLEAAGAKDIQHARVQVNPHHANFVYNVNAGSRDLVEVTIKMRELVYAEFGVWLEYEMELLGAFPEDLRRVLLEKRPPQFNVSKIEELKARFASKKSAPPFH